MPDDDMRDLNNPTNPTIPTFQTNPSLPPFLSKTKNTKMPSIPTPDDLIAYVRAGGADVEALKKQYAHYVREALKKQYAHRIIISQYVYDIHFLKKDKKDTKMNYTETVVILFDILHDRTLDENDYKIRYSAILSTGDVSPPKEITIKIDTTIHDMISAYEFETRADGALEYDDNGFRCYWDAIEGDWVASPQFASERFIKLLTSPDFKGFEGWDDGADDD